MLFMLRRLLTSLFIEARYSIMKRFYIIKYRLAEMEEEACDPVCKAMLDCRRKSVKKNLAKPQEPSRIGQ